LAGSGYGFRERHEVESIPLGGIMTARGSRVLLRAWMRWKWRSLDGIPRPADRAFASTHGDPVLECVALGNGSISGWGVASHQLGLVGALARALGRRFGRGVTVRGTLDPDLTVRTMRAEAARVPWAGAQVGIISIGPNEILDSRSPRVWQRELEALVTGVRARMTPGSTLAVVGIPPIAALSFLHGIGGSIMSALIERYNERAAAVCATIDGAQFVTLPDPGPLPTGQYRSAEQYAFWAEVIAGVVGVEAPAASPARPSAEERSRSVDRLHLIDDAVDTEPFDRIVRLAQSVFRTSAAAFTVLHGDWQWHLSQVGMRRGRMPRDQSICDIAVGQGTPLVVGDTWADERFDANTYVREGAGVRFYAGYPLRAPDGNLIGALCVFDPEPRDAEDVDVATLRDLALMIEAELDGARSGAGARSA
jgi:hypothetical protein